MKISIAIPTYNRPTQLAQVLDFLLASETDGFENIEIVVVDDGSSESAASVVESREPAPPFQLKFIRQPNSGPATARNTGFRNTSNEIILFIDDDILVTPHLIRVHYASHIEKPGSVIFGRSPLNEGFEDGPAKRYFDGLQADTEKEVGLIRRYDLASGNISFERSQFPDGEVYHGAMTTPGAEEFELASRLRESGIAVYQNNDACGWHLQSSDIEEKFKQEYKYGMSLAEAYLKLPVLMRNERIWNMVKTNGPINLRSDSPSMIVKKLSKLLASGWPVQQLVLYTTRFFERSLPDSRFLPLLYRTLCGLGLFAGVREGFKIFNKSL